MFSQIGPVDGRCRQNTHSHDTFVHVQLVTARSAQIHSSREHAWLKSFALVCQKQVCHPRSHVSHVATEHFYTICLTNITCLPTIFSLTVLSNLGPFWIGSRNPAGFTAECGYTESASPTVKGTVREILMEARSEVA